MNEHDREPYLAFDAEVKQHHGIETEDWCRGLYARHGDIRPAPLAVRTWGLVTIVYMEDPVVPCVDPVCEDCYQVWLERGGEVPSARACGLARSVELRKLAMLEEVDPGEAHYADPRYRCKRCGSCELEPHGMGTEIFRHSCRTCGADPA